MYVPLNKNDFDDSNNEAIDFINEAFIHCKVIAIDDKNQSEISKTKIDFKESKNTENGIILKSEEGENFTKAFVKAVAKHRFWEREPAL